MAYSFLVDVEDNSGGSGGSTTAAVDTTGVDFIAIVTSKYSTAAITVSDSKGNTWNALTNQTNGNANGRVYWSVPTSVGTGHTFSCLGTSVFAGLAVICFSGGAASPFDVENGASGNVASLATGSITPTADDEVIITGGGWNGGTVSYDVDSGVTKTANLLYSPNMGVAAGYKIQTVAAAINPTWSWTSTSQVGVVVASFKAAAAGGAATVRQRQFALMGMGA